jgi:hypothetical protein
MLGASVLNPQTASAVSSSAVVPVAVGRVDASTIQIHLNSISPSARSDGWTGDVWLYLSWNPVRQAAVGDGSVSEVKGTQCVRRRTPDFSRLDDKRRIQNRMRGRGTDAARPGVGGND